MSPAPPTDPAAQPARRLVRRTDNRVIAGVASGLAAYFNVDPVLVRVVFVVLTLAAAVGPLLYVLAWLLVPAADSRESIAQAALRRPPTLRTYVGVALVLLAIGILASAVSRPSVIWAVALIVFGIFLFRQEPEGPAPAADGTPAAEPATTTVALPGPPPTEPPGPEGWRSAAAVTEAAVTEAAVTEAAVTEAAVTEATVTERLDQPPSPGAPPPRWEPPAGWAAWSAPPPPPPKPPRSLLGPVTLGVAFLAVGTAALLANLGVIELSVGRALAVFLTVLGLGLLVGAWWGRALWLIPLGVLLVPVVAAAALLGSEPLGAGAGQRLWQPRTLAQTQPAYRLGAGDAVLDLSHVRFGAAPTRVDVGVGAGRIVAVVPDDTPVELRGRAGAGRVGLLGHTDQGAQVDTTWSEDAAVARRGDPPGRLTLDLHVGFGVVEVHRASELPLPGVPALAGPPPSTVPQEVP